MPTLAFYLFIEFLALIMLVYADSLVSDRKRKLIQLRNRFALFDMNFRITERHVCFIFSFLILFIVSAMRDHVGGDYYAYADAYLDINLGHISINSSWLSPGFVLLCKFLGVFVPKDYEAMFAVLSFITVLYLLKAIYKMSCNWMMSIYIYMLLLLLCIVRYDTSIMLYSNHNLCFLFLNAW